MATWTDPKTWSTGELVTASDMNTHIRDNLDYLKEPNKGNYELNEGANDSTSSATYAAVDSTNYSFSITLDVAGDVEIGFFGNVISSGGNINVFFDVTRAGTQLAGDDGIVGLRTSVTAAPGTSIGFVWRDVAVAAGTYTYQLVWKDDTATGVTLFAGAGTASGDLHPQFWVVQR